MDALREVVLEVYDRFIGLELSDVAVWMAASPRPLVGARRRAGARWIGENKA